MEYENGAMLQERDNLNAFIGGMKKVTIIDDNPWITVGQVIIIEEEKKIRGIWKICIVEQLVSYICFL